jgi:hypothetical protein
MKNKKQTKLIGANFYDEIFVPRKANKVDQR